MSMPTFDNTAEVLRAARSLGFVIPAPIATAAEMITELDAVLHQPEASTAALPATAKRVRARLDEVALERMTAASRREVAETWRRDAANSLADTVRESTAGWVQELCESYAGKVRELEACAASVRLDSTPAHISADLLADWHDGVNSVSMVDWLVTVRLQFGQVLREEPNGGNPNAPANRASRLGSLPYFAVVRTPNPDNGVPAVLAEWSQRFDTLEAAAVAEPAARWQTWIDAARAGWLCFSMPGAGELRAARMAHFNDFGDLGNVAHAQDGGRSLTALLTRCDATFTAATEQAARVGV